MASLTSLSMLFLALTFRGLPPLLSQQVQHQEVSPASTPAPSTAKDGERGNGSGTSRAGGGGLNVLAAILVTASSVMVLMAVRYTGCARSDSSASTASESENENESLSEDLEAAMSSGAIIHNTMNNNNTSPDPTGASNPNIIGASEDSKKKKPSKKMVVESIDKLTVLADYESLTRIHGVVVPSAGGLSCSVCLCEFMSGSEIIRLLPACRHFFHLDCIDVWLVSNMTCPVCRRSVVPCAGKGGSSTGE